MRRHGFTLIELLIVVMIISILAAIALPNFLEFQIRAKISASKNDMRTLVTAMTAYQIDNNFYPIDRDEEFGTPGGIKNDFDSWVQLTTPIAYISTVLYSRFNVKGIDHHNPYDLERDVYMYWGPASHNPRRWAQHNAWYAVVCAGPDFDRDFHADFIDELVINDGPGLNTLYDPSNGTVSSGDIVWTGRGLHN